MYNEIISIDDSFIKENLIDKNQYEYAYRDLYFAYYLGYSEVSLQAVCNGICLSNEEWAKRMFDLALRTHSPVFLMAEGGTGKTTLLCQTALYSAAHGVKTLFFDTANEIGNFMQSLDRVVSENVDKKMLLCVDNFSREPELLSVIYSHIKDVKNWKRYSKFHLILCERINESRKILSESSRFPLWRREGLVFCIHNGKMKGTFTDELRKNFFGEQNIYNLLFPHELKYKIVQKKIQVIGSHNKLNEKLVSDIQEQLEYEKGIEEILHDFQYRYNQSVLSRLNGDTEEDIKEYRWPWMEWKKMMAHLDNKCTFPISSVYKYIAALSLFNIDISFMFLKAITGLDNRYDNELKECFGSSVHTPVQVITGIKNISIIRLKHDTDADVFFRNHAVKITDTLLELVNKERLDTDTVLSFEKHVFSLSNFFFPDLAPKGVDLKRILDVFYKNDYYKQIIIDHGRLYSLELANLAACHTDGVMQGEYITETFIKTIKNYDILSKNACLTWLKFVSFSLTYCEKMPKGLIDYVCKQNYRQLSAMMGTLKNAKFIKENEKYEKRVDSYLKLFFTKIIKDVDTNDIVSVLGLGEIFEKKNQYAETRKLYQPFLNPDLKSFHIITRYLASYDREIKMIYDEDKPDLDKIDRLKQWSDDEHRKWIRYLYSIAKKNTEPDSAEKKAFVAIATRFAHNLKKKKQFQEAFEIIQNIPDDYPDIFKKSAALGMVYQDYDPGNKYQDLAAARLCLEQAVTEFENRNEPTKKKEKKSKLSILRPLLHVYIEIKDMNHAKSVAEQILKIEKTDSEACMVLQKAAQRMQSKGKKEAADVLLYTVIGGICFIYKVVYDTITVQRVGKALDKYEIEIPKEIQGKMVSSIGNKCFDHHSLIEKIKLPDTIKTIGHHAFSGCRCLREINIPDGCEYIGPYAFQWCKSLTCIEMPTRVQVIQEATFISCFNLAHIFLKEGLKEIERAAFFNCENLQVLIPDSTVKIENEAFVNCNRDLIGYSREKRAEWFHEWPYKQNVEHSLFGSGEVINVIFRDKDEFDILVRFHNKTLSVKFPKEFEKDMLFGSEESKLRLERMLKRIKKKEERESAVRFEDHIMESMEKGEIVTEKEKEMRKKRSVFISHAGEEIKLAERFKKSLEPYGYQVILDKEDLNFWDNMDEFMELIRKSDYVLLIVSDHYLHSEYCLCEVQKLLKDDYKQKIFPVIIHESVEEELFQTTYQAEIIKYWEERKNDLEKKINEIKELQHKKGLIESYNNVLNYADIVGEFLSKISDLLLPSWQKSFLKRVDTDAYAKRMHHQIQSKEGDLGSEDL